MNDTTIENVRARRLLRRGMFLTTAGLICAAFSVVTQVPDFFFMAGFAFQTGAVFAGLASLNARRYAVRARLVYVRSLRP